ncbi:galactose ABC transporter substrate-binding protein [Clostridium chromiireducens]|uniref:D-galactose/methyl-galactoside binding periplasmic protein MglB n=1 Tax=Clostridium chromiireducens TaxID=225345 RepID=A0A1V4IKG5_9CLOT|nr:galactose ABC transporter substrate-binding protein [Clostridium chromiireducens]OPJ60426.1 D-galactose-binding periplasmic protein precursor [Clostridium chromiireducens]
MKQLGIRIISIIAVIFVFSTAIESNCAYAKMINSGDSTVKTIKVAMIVYDINAPFINEIFKNLAEITKENGGNVQITTFSANESQETENEIIKTVLESSEYDLLLLALVDINSVQEVVARIKQYNIPVIFFNREPYKKDAIQSYGKAVFVGSTLEDAGIFQGEILIDEWNKNKELIDRNNDDIMEYVMLKGREESLDTDYRTKYSILTIIDAGINTQELTSQIANWDEEQAKKLMTSIFLRYGDRIEAIIANNDAMAIGAIKALQSFGYNAGDKNKTISVVGVDAIPEAIDFIKKGYMTGTVIQDARGIANAVYRIGMNLIANKKPLEETDYTFDDSGVSVRIPYRRYVPSQTQIII